jgi:hypothetical protein
VHVLAAGVLCVSSAPGVKCRSFDPTLHLGICEMYREAE